MNSENVFLMIGFSCGGSVFYVYFIVWWVIGVIVQPTITFVCCAFLDDTIYMLLIHTEMKLFGSMNCCINELCLNSKLISSLIDRECMSSCINKQVIRCGTYIRSDFVCCGCLN